METITACATPSGKGAVSIVRLSGASAFQIASLIFSPMPKSPRRLTLGKLTASAFTDTAMCVWFQAPHSYTGEDMIEFHLHGGVAITDGVLKECINKGARLALNGEFSKRAFLNGKLNLENAEGIVEMIDAESNLAVRCGNDMLASRLTGEAQAMQSLLTDIVAEIEAALDYPEENEYISDSATLNARISLVTDKLHRLLKSSELAPIVRDGANIAIVGEVNAGKSSLFNALLNADRAIVSSTPGTTRDVVSASLCYRDLKFNLFDTAGLRETSDDIEMQGIVKADYTAKGADLVLYACENCLSEQDCAFIDSLTCPVTVVYTKSDVIERETDKRYDCVCVSVKDRDSLSALADRIYDRFVNGDAASGGLIVVNSRQIDCLKRAYDALLRATAQATMDCAVVPIYEAWDALGEICGSTVREDIVDRIFERFCLGK